MFVINATDVTQDVAEKQLINKFKVSKQIKHNGIKASDYKAYGNHFVFLII